MKNKTNKTKLLFSLLLPLCKDKSGNFDTQKTNDCKRMVVGVGSFAMILGTILMLVGFGGLVIKPDQLGNVWLWVAVGFGTLFTCIGIWLINTATSLVAHVQQQLSPNENEQE